MSLFIMQSVLHIIVTFEVKIILIVVYKWQKFIDNNELRWTTMNVIRKQYQ